eukprot:3518114-Pleurochrysis_carterae.AAC.1
MAGTTASIAFPPKRSIASHMRWPSSRSRLLHGMMLVYGTPTVIIGFLKSAEDHPAARRLAREHVIFT